MHLSVAAVSEQYRLVQRRPVYVSPTSFMQLIDLFKLFLVEKRGALRSLISRLEAGLATLTRAAADVTQLTAELVERLVRLRFGHSLCHHPNVCTALDVCAGPCGGEASCRG